MTDQTEPTKTFGEPLDPPAEAFTPVELEAIEYLALEWLDYQERLDRQGQGRELFGGMLVESVQRKAMELRGQKSQEPTDTTSRT